VAAGDFFVDAFATACRPDELLTHIVVPRSSGAYGYSKLKLCEGSWPIATAAAMQDATKGATAITLGAVARRPIRLDVTLLGSPAEGAARLDELIRQALDDPWDDVLAPGDYRRDVAPVVARRAWEDMLANDRELPR
jgi:CO/xanthine dehydrogenase FAD-binding subunit